MLRRLTPVVVALALTAGRLAVAQEGTPGPVFPAEPVAPDPSECRVEPRSAASLTDLVATPIAEGAAPPDFEALVNQGEPTDAATIAAVTATVREIYACFNAGDPLRAYALFGDDALRGLLALSPPAELLPELVVGTPEPPTADSWTKVRVRDVRVLPDGRATAFVDGKSPAGSFALFAVFSRRDDRYLIEAFVATGGPATPTA